MPVTKSEGNEKAEAVLIDLNVEVFSGDGDADGAELV